MVEQSSLSSPCKDSSLSSLPLTVPDAKAARDAQGHFLQPFKLAAVRYAVACGRGGRLLKSIADPELTLLKQCLWCSEGKGGVGVQDHSISLVFIRTPSTFSKSSDH